MYKVGDSVRVKRTSGVIEDGWWVLAVHCDVFTAPEVCPVTVILINPGDEISIQNVLDGTVPSGARTLLKTVTMLDLIHWNKLGAAG